MKAFVLDSNSWHFRLANYGTRRVRDYETTDICEYTRNVVRGSFCLLLVVLGTLLFIAWLGGSIYNIYDILVNDAKLEPWTVVFITMSLGLIGATIIIAAKEWYERLPRKDKPEKEPGFVKLAYRKVKDKTCARIEFKQNEA